MVLVLAWFGHPVVFNEAVLGHAAFSLLLLSTTDSTSSVAFETNVSCTHTHTRLLQEKGQMMPLSHRKDVIG